MSDNNAALTKAHVLAAVRKADAVIGIGDTHGVPRPQAYVEALAMLNAARAADRATTAPPAAEKPKDIAKWIDAAADTRSREAARREVIDELLLTWERAVASAGLAAVPDICARLDTTFDEHVEKFDSLATAPRSLSGHETAEEVEAHTAALRVAGALTTALMQRAVIADAVGYEVETIGPDALWLVLNPCASATRDGVEDALATFRGRIPQTVGEWDQIRQLGLRLAALGEVAARRQRHAKVCHAIGMGTPERGVRGDYTYGDVASGDLSSSRNGRLMQAESDQLFDRAQPMSLS
jgi:hypothetical protein